MAATKKRADTKKRSQDKVEQTEMGAVSALDLLEADHQEVDGFFDEYENLEDAGEKERMALKICLALTVHTQIEEEIFYPAAREAIEKAELIDEAIVEHASAKQLIAEIEVVERHEEPVVEKRVTGNEEIVVRKEVDQHTETVRDTVRRTEVEIDDDRAKATTPTNPSTLPPRR